MDFPGGINGKAAACHAEDTTDIGVIPGSGRCPVVGNGNLDLQRADNTESLQLAILGCLQRWSTLWN